MKLYYFRPNNYGAEYFTVAETPEKALSNLKKYLYKKTLLPDSDPDSFYKDFHIEKYELWKDVKINNLPLKYSLDEYDNNTVIETEIS